jgi:hypothetical protein
MKRREQIRMSDAEVWAYLEEQRRLAVATNDRDGYPHVVGSAPSRARFPLVMTANRPPHPAPAARAAAQI